MAATDEELRAEFDRLVRAAEMSVGQVMIDTLEIGLRAVYEMGVRDGLKTPRAYVTGEYSMGDGTTQIGLSDGRRIIYQDPRTA